MSEETPQVGPGQLYVEKDGHWVDVGTVDDLTFRNTEAEPSPDNPLLADHVGTQDLVFETTTPYETGTWLQEVVRRQTEPFVTYDMMITGKKSVPLYTGELWLYPNRAAHRRALRLATQRRRIARRRGVPVKVVDVVTWLPRAQVSVSPIADAIGRFTAQVAPLRESFLALGEAAAGLIEQFAATELTDWQKRVLGDLYTDKREEIGG